MNSHRKFYKHTRKPAIMFFTLVLAAGLAAAAHGAADMMQQSKTQAEQFRAGMPPAAWECPFEYEDADIVRFVNDELLLVGAVDNDVNGWPVALPSGRTFPPIL